MTPKEIEELVVSRVVTACLTCGLSGIQVEVAEDGEITIWKEGTSAVRLYLPEEHGDSTLVEIRFLVGQESQERTRVREEWNRNVSPRRTLSQSTPWPFAASYSPLHLARIALGFTDGEGMKP